MSYVRPDLDVNEDAIAQDAYDVVSGRVPGWQPTPGTLDTALLEATARQAAELRRLVLDVSDTAVVQGLATSVFGYPRFDALPATVTVTFLLSASAAGYVVPAGTTFALAAPDGTLVAFDTVTDSATVDTAATANAIAVEVGDAGNGLTGVGVMIDALPEVAAVAAVTVSAGGIEVEAEEAYLDRIVRRMAIVAEHPIVPDDFAVMAMDQPGVARAMALDLYDPVTNTTNNARTITVVVQNDAGQPVGGTVSAAVDALLQARREVGFVVHVTDPVYGNLTVAAAIVVQAALDGAATAQAVQDALTAYLSPATWGASAGGETDVVWSSRSTVYVNQLIAVAGSVPGVVRVADLTINGGHADVVLAGGVPYALPRLTAPPTVTWT